MPHTSPRDPLELSAEDYEALKAEGYTDEEIEAGLAVIEFASLPLHEQAPQLNDVRRVSSGAPWEARVGYCRAVRAGPHIWVAGTVAVGDDGQVHGPGDVEVQTARCIAIIAGALAQVGADLRHVVRTRAFATDMSEAAQAGFARAHSAAFGAHPPASTLVGVAALAAPEYLIEIEADAFIPDSHGQAA